MDHSTSRHLTMAGLRVIAALLLEDSLSPDVEQALNLFLLEVEGIKQGAL